jgi:hypothetical protein
MTDGVPEVPFHSPGFSWRVAASIVTGMGWLAFIIIWLFFYAGSFSIYQNLAIVIVSLIVVFGTLAAIWVSWGLRFASQMEGIDQDWREQRRHWFGWRGYAATAVWFSWLVLLVIWLFFFAPDYNAYQNIAIIIVSLVVAGGASALLWMPFGQHHD